MIFYKFTRDALFKKERTTVRKSVYVRNTKYKTFTGEEKH